MSRKAGYTLIELLVVIAVIGVLVALLLPAVQAARETARNMSCKNNLKQIGLAVLNYHDVHQVFPRAAYPAALTNGGWEAHGNGPFAMLLPYLEQKPVYDLYDFNRGFVDNGPAVNPPRIKLLLCPSDSVPEAGSGNNYALSTGPNVAWTADPADAIGIAHNRVSHGIKDVVDGTSNTILAAEIIKGDGSHGPTGKFTEGDVIRGMRWNISRIKPTVSELISFDRQCRSTYGYQHHYGEAGWYWFQPHPYDSTFNTIAPPNPPYANCVEQWIQHDTDGPGVFPSRSRHVGGANHLLCDGSIRFVSNSTEHVLYQDLGTIRGSEAVQVP